MSEAKIVTLDELRAHNTRESFYALIHGKGVSAPQLSTSSH